MSRESFKHPVDPNPDRNPPRQIHGVTTMRTLMFFQNAISELQDRIEQLEARLEAAENPPAATSGSKRKSSSD